MMNISLTYLFVIFIVILLSYMLLSWNLSTIHGNKYLIARPLPLIGNSFSFWKCLKKFGWPDFHIHMKQTYGNVYGYKIFSNLSLTIHDCEILKHILFTDFNNFPNRRKVAFSGILERSLLHAKGPEWRKQRKLLTPAFSSGKLKEISPSIIGCASKTAKQIINFANSNESFEIKSITGGFSMNVIASSQFGLEIDAQNSEDNLFVKHAKDIVGGSKKSKIKTAMMILTPWLWTLIGKIRGKEMSFQSDDTQIFFQKMVRKLLSVDVDFKDIRPNIISILKNNQCADNSADNLNSQVGLSEEEIISNSALLIAAGYDTTANTLGFLLYSLAIYPEVQNKVFREILSIFGDDMPINYEGLAHLKYLDKCINETLRIYPIAAATTRVALSDCKYKDVEILKNWVINIPIRAIHMNPEIWPHPEKFDPERFSQDSKIGRDRTSFIPFGAGPRNCIGIRLAFLEMKILVVELLRQIQFTKCEKTEVPIKLNQSISLLSPSNGIWLKAKLRENNLQN